MDARRCTLVLAALALTNVAATFRTDNFIVVAPTAEIAQQVGRYAEHYRRELALLWMGQVMPKWKYPCMVRVKVDQVGAGGQTNFAFDRGEVSGWNMSIQGSLERILDSVLPHEVNHTVFACHFRRPLPRWADEGAATLMENESERRRQMLLCRQILGTAQKIPMNTLLKMMDYPENMDDVLNLYAEGYVLCDLLVQKGGRQKYLQFIETGFKQGWERAVSLYGYQSVAALEKEFDGWVMAGCPPQIVPADQILAQTNSTAAQQEPGVMVRSQSPEDETVTIQGQVTEVPGGFTPPQPVVPLLQDSDFDDAQPANRSSDEPVMLAQVDRGEGELLGIQAPELPSAPQPRLRRAPAVLRRNDFEEPEAPPAPVMTRGRSFAASPLIKGQAQPTGNIRRQLRSPSLSLSSRPQSGQPQAFPIGG